MDVNDTLSIMEITETEKSRDEIIRDGKNVYLRIPLDQAYEAGYAFRMITGVQPACLLPVGIVREGHQVFADYRISGWTALSSVPPEDLMNLLYGFVNALKNAADELAECLLSADDLSLEPGHIFLRRETGEVRFCYLLEGSGSFGESLQKLMDFFMKNARPGGEQEVLLLYGLYQKSREENVTPEVLSALRTKLMSGQSAPAQHSDSPDKQEEGRPVRLEKAPDEFRRLEHTVFREDGTEEIYERLGMEPQNPETSFSRWKKERESRKEKKAEDCRQQLKEPEAIPVRQVYDEEPKSKHFFKKHLPEILIGAAALILAVFALIL